MVAVINRTGSIATAIDVFCGYGGSAQGMVKAGADLKAAANHNQLAIDCHSANYPLVDHWRADLVDQDSADYMDPADLPASRFSWWSPGCTHHTQANAKKLYQRGRQTMLFGDEDFDDALYANSERSRVTMSCVLRYADRHRPELITVENVVEVCHWGPGRDGSTFRWWMQTLKNLGYEVECCFFNSMFFPPCPQSRDRIYIVAWLKGNKRPDLDYHPISYCTSDRCGGKIVGAVQTWKPRTKAWPLPRWGKYDRQYIYTCPDCRERVEPAAWPAYSAIDWSFLGPKIGERAAQGLKDLAPATIARIRRALAKFSGCPPIVIPAKSVWGSERPVYMPLQTQTTQQDKALMTTLVQQRFNGNPSSTFGQVPTITTQQSDITLASVVVPQAGNTYEGPNYTRARHVADQLFTQHTTQAFGFASMPSLLEIRGGGSAKSGQHAITEPIPTLTAGGKHHGLVSPGLFAKFNGGPNDTAWHSVFDALNTVTTVDTHGLVVLPWVDQYLRGADSILVTEQLATVMTHIRHALASVEQIPFESITDDDLMGVHYRMLEPDPELRFAMAFSPDYILLGNKTQMTAGLGNAVTPPTAEWITDRALETLRGRLAA